MKTRVFLPIVVLFALAGGAQAQKRTAAKTPADAAYAEMTAIFGMVPSFFKVVPAEFVPSVWEDFKGIQLDPNPAIPAKYKDLISIAVAAQIPCLYCTYADTEFAKLDGASDREIQEAVLMAALTRKWSTILNGHMQDEGAFRKEIDSALAFVKKGGKPGARPIQVVDAASAMADIEQTFGMVPTFFKQYPKAGLAGAWNEFKTVQLNPKTAVPGKYKELIGLGVAAQIPCRYCLYVHTEVAKLNGATQAEIDEALAVAAATRQWSTYFYGVQLDMAQFRKEIDSVVRRLRQAAKAG